MLTRVEQARRGTPRLLTPYAFCIYVVSACRRQDRQRTTSGLGYGDGILRFSTQHSHPETHLMTALLI